MLNKKQCTNCMRELEEGFKFCPMCGQPTDGSSQEKECCKYPECVTDYLGKHSKVKKLENIVQYELYKISDDVLPECGIEFNG